MKKIPTFTLEDVLEQYGTIVIERDSLQSRLNTLYAEFNNKTNENSVLLAEAQRLSKEVQDLKVELAEANNRIDTLIDDVVPPMLVGGANDTPGVSST